LGTQRACRSRCRRRATLPAEQRLRGNARADTNAGLLDWALNGLAMEALELRLQQLGCRRGGRDKWRCPACGNDSLSIGRGKKGLVLRCFTTDRCSTDRVLRELGWARRELFYREHQESGWATMLDRDLFGRPLRDNRVRDNTHSTSSCRTTRTNSPKDSIEDRVLSRDARAVVTVERLDPSDGEEQLARGEIELDRRLQHGPLPARATATDVQVAQVMLRLFRLSVAMGEYRELPRSIRRIAADCGWDVAARNRVSKVMQRLVHAGTFSRRELEPTQGHPRGIYCYSLPVSANREFLDSLDQEQQSGQPLEQSALGVEILAEPAPELEAEEVV
jgi:hypothetical protein